MAEDHQHPLLKRWGDLYYILQNLGGGCEAVPVRSATGVYTACKKIGFKQNRLDTQNKNYLGVTVGMY